MSTIVVCGGRGFSYRSLLFPALDIVRTELGVTRVAHGACGQNYDDPWLIDNLRGADRLAEAWAFERGLAVAWYPVAWSRCHNQQERSKAARERVEVMFRKEDPVACIAFPGGRGTQMTMGIAQRMRVPVRYIPSMRAITSVEA